MSDRYIDRFFENRDGLRLHYRDYAGSADPPPLICLHGLTRNCRDFADVAERYSPRFRVIALDCRGRGESDYDPVPERYVPPTYVGDLIELLDGLEIAEAIFIGTSLGGVMTMLLAVVQPSRIAGAILNDVGPEVERESLERIASYVGKDVRFSSWDEAAERIAANNSGTFDHYTHEDWVKVAKRSCRIEGSEIRFDYDMAIAKPFKALRDLPPVDMWPMFAALSAKPLLLVRGGNSDLLSAQAVVEMQQAAPQMRATEVEGVGHPPDLSEPQAVAAVDAFLDRFLQRQL